MDLGELQLLTRNGVQLTALYWQFDKSLGQLARKSRASRLDAPPCLSCPTGVGGELHFSFPGQKELIWVAFLLY